MGNFFLLLVANRIFRCAEGSSEDYMHPSEEHRQKSRRQDALSDVPQSPLEEDPADAKTTQRQVTGPPINEMDDID